MTAILDPLPLDTRLFSRSIIDCALLQALPPFQKTNILLSAVLGKIQIDPSVFGAFFSALNEDPSVWPPVESMQGLLSTTSGAHGGVESRDGGEELSTPTVKRKCVHEGSNTSETISVVKLNSHNWHLERRNHHLKKVVH